MADLVITRRITRQTDGAPIDADSAPVLRDPDNTCGLRRADTLAVIVAAGTALVRQSTGVYSLTVTGLLAGVEYEYWIETTINGSLSRVRKTYTAPAGTLPSYLTVQEADALAAMMPGLIAYKAAAGDARLPLLAAATARVDNAHRWQGRRYATDQVLEFPRVPYGDSHVWDLVDGVAVVPQTVKLATLYEANNIADGTMDRVAKKIASGLAGQSTGSLSEQYRQGFAMASGVSPLCVDAERLLGRYTLRTGRLL